MNRLKDLTGRVVGCLTVVRREPGHAPTRWLCRCECGREKVATSSTLHKGVYKKCRCDVAPSDRRSRLPEYAIWRGIISRCENSHVAGYSKYGGRGITIAAEWRHDFAAFLAHIGHRPSPAHSVDRIDNAGNYAPGNVRWAPVIVQANNKRRTRYVVYRGTRLPLAEAVRAAGSIIHREAAWVRIRTGWTVESALETPRLHISGNAKERGAA